MKYRLFCIALLSIFAAYTSAQSNIALYGVLDEAVVYQTMLVALILFKPSMVTIGMRRLESSLTGLVEKGTSTGCIN
ncbi:hypothetical protein [Caballeronia sordidicola]|uniref:hypothetical protein n=1 Tax=Caballeronia sordidicola TaxID=196367 RepID=UPI0004D01F89|nr:hypothetical protein [Caballeronia sordidicola]